jgi:hypothetical protein
MKKTLFIFAILISGLAWAQSEKEADTSEYVLSNRGGSATVTIDSSVQTFDRRWGVSLDLNCAATSSDSSSNGMGYAVFDLTAPGGEALDAAVTTSAVADTVMFVYCSFDPANPADNLVFWDDDDGSGSLSAITPADGVTLSAGDYKLVVCSYSAGHDGDVEVSVSGNFDIAPEGAGGGGADVPTMSEWGMIAFTTLLMGFALFFMRRKN